jgi:predicted DCC family thiol-disulfide oxidoreductase YuxK
MRTAVHPPLDRPMLVFDGDCKFCRCWIERWRHVTGEEISYAEYQQAATRFPDVPESAFAEAVQLVEPDGTVTAGADAIFRAFELGASKGGHRSLTRLGKVPGVRSVARLVYRFVARHRMLFSRLTRPWCRTCSG